MTSSDPAPKIERMKRGSFPPYLNLKDAFDLARLIYENGGGQASYDVVSKLTGNSSSSSSFVKKTGALKLYGLVTEQNDVFYLTEFGTAIAAPVSENSAQAAKKAAFLNVAPFTKLFERLKGKLLPADEFLKNILEQDVQVPRELSNDWVKAFKDSARAAGLLFNRADGKTQILETPSSDLQQNRAETTENAPLQSVPATPVESTVASAPSHSLSRAVSEGSGHNSRFNLSDGRIAEFSIPIGITAKDAKRLKAFLKGLEFIIDSAVADDEESPI